MKHVNLGQKSKGKEILFYFVVLSIMLIVSFTNVVQADLNDETSTGVEMIDLDEENISIEEKSNLEVKISSLPVKINGVAVDNINTSTPILTYDGVTYIPLTDQYCEALGINLSIGDQHITINSFINNEKLKQDSIADRAEQSYFANIKESDLTVNNTNFKFSELKYPILEVNNDLYLPMDYQLTDELNWIVYNHNAPMLVIFTPSTDVTHLLLPSSSYITDNSKNSDEKGLSVGIKFYEVSKEDYITEIKYYIIIHNGYSKDIVNGKFKFENLGFSSYSSKYDFGLSDRNFTIEHIKAGETIIVSKNIRHRFSSENFIVKPIIREYELKSSKPEQNFVVSNLSYEPDLGLLTGKIINPFDEPIEDIKLNIVFTRAHINFSNKNVDGFYDTIINDQAIEIDKLSSNSEYDFQLEVNKDIKKYNIYVTPIPDYEVFKPEDDYEIIQYLDENFKTVNTSIGEVKLDFSVKENDSKFIEYDYWIQVDYDNYYIGDTWEKNVFSYIKNDKNIKSSTRKKVLKEMKEHMEKLAKSLIDVMPNTKFYGCYYDSWYKYKYLEVDLNSRNYNTWSNYKDARSYSDADETYKNAKISSFHWITSRDD